MKGSIDLAKVTIHHQKLIETFLPLGYEFSYLLQNEGGTEIRLVKRSSVDGCFEHLCFEQWANDRVRVYVRLGVVPGTTQWRDMFEDRRIEFADAKSIGPKLLSRADVTDWLNWILDKAPATAQQLASAEASSLLARTAVARSAASNYLRALELPIEHMPSYAAGQESVMSKESVAAAKQMFRDGLVTLPRRPNFEEVKSIASYRIALNTIVNNAATNGGTGAFTASTDPYRDYSLAWCLQIMASRIYGEPGWKLLDENREYP